MNAYSLDGVSFVAVRVSYGAAVDRAADAHLAKARTAGVPVLIAYHYTATGEGAAEPEEQAALFVTRCAVLGGVLGLAQDVEPLDPARPDPPARVRSFAHRFWLSARARAARPVATYGGDYLAGLDLPAEMAADPLWRSDWTAPYPTVRPWRAWTILQYAVTGSPKIDRNRFDGSIDELRAVLGIGGLAPERTSTPPELRRLLGGGSRGTDVRALQVLLNRWGASLSTDAIFGPDTEAAVRRFQGLHGICVDGVVDAPTWEKLIAP